jgi:hypothetical protein
LKNIWVNTEWFQANMVSKIDSKRYSNNQKKYKQSLT